MRSTTPARVLLLYLLSVPALQGDTLLVVADEFCPFICRNAEKPGIVMEILREIYRPLGHQLDWRPTPDLRAFTQVVYSPPPDGQHYLILANPAGGLDAIYSRQPFTLLEFCFYGRSGQPWHYLGPDSLAPMHLALIKGYGYEIEAEGRAVLQQAKAIT